MTVDSGRVASQPGSQATPSAAVPASSPVGADPSRDHGDYYDDYEEMPEGAEWCDRCQGMGIDNCYCGGDQCYCENYGEMECPTCDGEGWWVPTPVQLAARAENARLWREAMAHVSDSDESPQGRDGEAGSVLSMTARADEGGIAQEPGEGA